MKKKIKHFAAEAQLRKNERGTFTVLDQKNRAVEVAQDGNGGRPAVVIGGGNGGRPAEV